MSNCSSQSDFAGSAGASAVGLASTACSTPALAALRMQQLSPLRASVSKRAHAPVEVGSSGSGLSFLDGGTTDSVGGRDMGQCERQWRGGAGLRGGAGRFFIYITITTTPLYISTKDTHAYRRQTIIRGMGLHASTDTRGANSVVVAVRGVDCSIRRGVASRPVLCIRDRYLRSIISMVGMVQS